MTPIQPPMTDERLDRLVRQLLTERADDVAAVAMPAETMTAVVASHVRRGGIAERRTLLLVAAALLIVLAAGAVAVGSGLIRRGPEPQPAPQPVVVPPLDATSPAPSDAAMEPEHVFYTVFEELQVGEEGCTEANASRFGSCTSSRIWVADPDGSNARELFPESTDHRSILDVSAAGDAHGLHGAGRSRRPAGLGHAPRRAGASRRRSRDERRQQRGARRRMHWRVRL